MRAILPPDASFADPEALRRRVIAAVLEHARGVERRDRRLRFRHLESRLARDLVRAGIGDKDDGLARGLLLAAYKAAGIRAPEDLG